MRRVVTIVCLIFALVSSASGQNVRKLVRQARQGNVQAYESLAICYRDGVKLEKSWINMLCMYEIYC